MKKINLTGKHIFLLFLFSPGVNEEINEPILGKTRIVKGLFLFDREVKKDFLKDSNFEIIKFPEFYSWKFGPFAKEIYDDIEFFVNNGFIEEIYSNEVKNEVELIEEKDWEEDYLLDEVKIEEREEYYETQYLLTKKGIEFVSENYYSKLSDNQKQILKRFKISINKASITAIIRYTYLKYPDYTENSVIKDKIFG